MAMSWKGRDRGCGTLTEADIGSSFTLCGWVHRQRNLGGEDVIHWEIYISVASFVWV